MYLYLARHAEAARVGGEIVLDADRILTPQGEQEASLMGRALARLDPNLEMVMTSPFKRAVQTGELIGREICDTPVVHALNNLAPGFNRKSLLEELIALSGGGRILAVGHQPDMSDFLSSLVAGSARTVIAFPPAAVAKVFIPSSVSVDEATLHWLLTPETVKSLIPQL